jgi:hypothetical protein
VFAIAAIALWSRGHVALAMVQGTLALASTLLFLRWPVVASGTDER